MIEKRQRDWITHQKQCYRINQSRVNIWSINCRINCYISTSTLYCFLYTIKSSFYSSARHTSSIIARALLSIYLLDNFLQRLHEHLHYSQRKDSEIHEFASQIDVFFSTSFETTFRFVRSHFIYSICSTIFFRNCTNLIFITVWDIWRKHTRLFVKSTRSFLFHSKDFSIRSISISFRHHENLHFRDLYRSYDFDFFLVEIVIHIRRATSESVNHSTLFRRNTSFSLQSNHDRRWLFRKEQFSRFEWYRMSDLLLEIIQWILHFRVVEEAFSKRITLLARHTTSARSRIKNNSYEIYVENNSHFARQISEHIRRAISKSTNR